MADLDYGYEITIETPGTSDPAATPTNQWQRKQSGGAWVDISGETNETYIVDSSDRECLIRLEQDFSGAKAYSNELQVVDKALTPSPCDIGIGSNAINISTFGPIQSSWGEGNKLIITGKDWVKYISGYSVVFSTGSAPPNFSSSNSSGKDQILVLGKTETNYVVVSKAGYSWISTSGTGSWTQKSTNIHGRSSFQPVGARSDGTVVVTQGKNITGSAGSNITYTTNGITWTEPRTSFPNLTTSDSFGISGSNGYFCARFNNTRYYNLVQGDLRDWGSFEASKTPGHPYPGAYGHLGVLYENGGQYHFYNPFTDTLSDFTYPWLKEAGQGYDITGVTPQTTGYDGGVYWISASKGVAMSSCDGVNWKLHRNSAMASENKYKVKAAFLANQNKWHLIEAYSFYDNGAVSSIS